MVRADRQETRRTILDISDIYLAEMADQMAGHFDTTMNSQFVRDQQHYGSITEADLESMEMLQAFCGRTVKNAYAFVAAWRIMGIIIRRKGIFLQMDV